MTPEAVYGSGRLSRQSRPTIQEDELARRTAFQLIREARMRHVRVSDPPSCGRKELVEAVIAGALLGGLVVTLAGMVVG